MIRPAVQAAASRTGSLTTAPPVSVVAVSIGFAQGKHQLSLRLRQGDPFSIHRTDQEGDGCDRDRPSSRDFSWSTFSPGRQHCVCW